MPCYVRPKLRTSERRWKQMQNPSSRGSADKGDIRARSLTGMPTNQSLSHAIKFHTIHTPSVNRPEGVPTNSGRLAHCDHINSPRRRSCSSFSIFLTGKRPPSLQETRQASVARVARVRLAVHVLQLTLAGKVQVIGDRRTPSRTKQQFNGGGERGCIALYYLVVFLFAILVICTTRSISCNPLHRCLLLAIHSLASHRIASHRGKSEHSLQ